MSDRKSTIQKCRNYFYGDLNSLYSGFLERFKDPQVAVPLSIQNFVAQNEVRAIIEKRCSMAPIDGMAVQVFDRSGASQLESLSDWLTEWMDGANFGEGRGFTDFAGEILLNLELDGEAALKLIVRDGVPMVRRIPGESLTIATNPDNVFEVAAILAEWTKTVQEESSEREATIKESIDAQEYRIFVDGKETVQKHGLGFIPVVVIKREDQEGDPHGRSGVWDLVEPQDNLNRCLTNIARANKYGPWGLYCTEETGAPLPEGEITVAPGALVATPIRKVSGDGASECLFQEKEEILDAMYRIAGISRSKADEIAQADRTSGKALVILNAQGKRYISNLLARLRKGYERIFSYALTMSGKISSPDAVRVHVAFASLDREDPSVSLARGKLLFEAGLPREALVAMGYEESRAQVLVNEREVAGLNVKTIQNLLRPDYDA